MAGQTKQHRIERISHLLSKRIQERVTATAKGFSGNQDPPFAVKLTEDEQIELYLQIDSAGWQKMAEQNGWAEVKKYSDAMGKLIEKKFGHGKGGPVVEGAADEIRGIDGMDGPAALSSASPQQLNQQLNQQPAMQQPAMPAMTPQGSGGQGLESGVMQKIVQALQSAGAAGAQGG